MKTPKTQKELLDIIENQNKQIDSLRKAVALLEKRINMVSVNAERTRHQNRRLNEQIQLLQLRVKQYGQT